METMGDSRAEAFRDAVVPLQTMIEMLRLYGPRTVLPGLESMLDVCRVASTDPTAVDEASRLVAGTRRTISRPLSDVVINAENAADLTARN